MSDCRHGLTLSSCSYCNGHYENIPKTTAVTKETHSDPTKINDWKPWSIEHLLEVYEKLKEVPEHDSVLKKSRIRELSMALSRSEGSIEMQYVHLTTKTPTFNKSKATKKATEIIERKKANV